MVNFTFSYHPNIELIKNLVEGFIEKPEIDFLRRKIHVDYFEFLEPPKIKRNMKFKTISPIIIKTVKEDKGVLKQWNLNPNDIRFYENMQKNLIREYKEFYGDYDGDEYLKVVPTLVPSREKES
ncbi:hypothetical protein MTTB_05030 [Methanothermobacter tenebrarum]|jgi:CRISPR-associated endoribonuclease Cas6|uniref:CRISPR associated protein Cas6 C-terminal domain-containing protein n=1 Tax=Methanothermobacter tenebrarum TaxID=680118 RepID=A0ABN6PAD1_9EURY|nr:CRISPR-associated endoribonuclease Cas6 [Methanothermobacter tenebrarum]BDH79124.1 hypothetical protein MTTB_05030 [Methanothermobacter tenebrarum]